MLCGSGKIERGSLPTLDMPIRTVSILEASKAVWSVDIHSMIGLFVKFCSEDQQIYR